ncbi:hypothetical protein V8E54_009569 [Elaphomyces granulatus]|jgi:hypothetical protein
MEGLKPPFDENIFRCLERSKSEQNLHNPDSANADKRLSEASKEVSNPPSCTSSFRHLLPASYRTEPEKGEIKGDIIPARTNHVENDLSVKRLNDIHRWLWLAGMPMPPRPLTYQLASSRQIVVNERMDLHLVWTSSFKIFLKPIPRYLLDHQFWKEELNKEDLHKCALGFLKSYSALIQHESDFYIARKKRLIPSALTWDSWVAFVDQLYAGEAKDNVNERYEYGELRLSRLNKIYWMHGYARGYRSPFQTYSQMFRENVAPVAGAIVYIALALTAMQVGLAIPKLSENDAFVNASYGFVIFSILAPLVLTMLIIFVVTIFILHNLMVAVVANKKFTRKKDQVE